MFIAFWTCAPFIAGFSLYILASAISAVIDERAGRRGRAGKLPSCAGPCCHENHATYSEWV
jgi:hypothetical protein